jgi:two-component system OmpR family response regulator
VIPVDGATNPSPDEGILPAKGPDAHAMGSQLPPEDATGTIKVVLVEDDERLAQLTARYLERHDVVVFWARNGRDGLAEVARQSPDVVLLDVMLPGLAGLDVCREIRARSDVPIIMVTAQGEEADRVLGLEFGADDYVPKPFSSRELLARIRAQVRRARGNAGPSKPRAIEVGPLAIDPAAMTATVDGRPIVLTTYEFALLRALAEHAGRVLSREQLLYLSRGSADETFDRSIDVHVSRLRQKLGDDSRNPRLLKTVRGTGYMLVDVGRGT